MSYKLLQKIMGEKNMDVSIFYNIDGLSHNTHMLYYTQYEGVGCLVIPRTSRPFLIVPKMEVERARQSNSVVYQWKKKTSLFESVYDIMKRKKIKSKKIGIDKTVFTLSAYRGLRRYFKKRKFGDLSKILPQIRQIKTPREISIIKKGCTLTNSIMNECFSYFREKKFKNEIQVAAFLEGKANLHGGVSFPPIVASGRHAAQPHYTPQNKRLAKGFCVVDFGIRYKGYCTDITRTVYFGKPSKKDIQLYEFLMHAQEKSIREIMAGDTGHDIYGRLVNDLGKYAKFFTHGLGHGIGINIHELPNLSKGSKDTIENNMIFTVEPGIYLPNKLGIRIEDDIIIEKGKIKVLTTVPKNLIYFPVP